MLIFRYLVKEVVTTVIATTAVLMLIFMSTQFVHYLGDAALGRFTAGVLLHIMLLQVPYLLGLLMPLGLFLALLLSYGRLYIDREMTVLFCCGFSQGTLLKMSLVMAGVVAVIVAILTIWIGPHVAMAQKELMVKARNAPLVETILPGRFFSTDGGRQVFYVENISRDHKYLQDIFVAKLNTAKNAKQKDDWNVVSASNGYQTGDENPNKHLLVVSDGYRYSGMPGDDNFEVQKFGKFTYHMQTKDPVIQLQAQTMSTWSLIKAGFGNANAQAELQWRLSMPLSVILLALLAVPMSKVNPRQGKFAQLLPSILIYILYANMMFVGRDWVQSGAVSPIIGLWWLHGLLLLFALNVMFWRSNWPAILKSRFRS